jgi:hypothetical protein
MNRTMRSGRQPHESRTSPGTSSLHRAVLVAVSLTVALLGGLLAVSPASAAAGTGKAAKAGTPKGDDEGNKGDKSDKGKKGKTEVVKVTIDLAAQLVDNLCNTDLVNLHGKATITTRTTTRPDGTYSVQSTFDARHLTGERIAPPPAYGYTGDQVDDTYSYTAPPNTTVTVQHYVKLIPQADAPSMWLVVVTHEVITPDGTIPTPDHIYLTCSKPSSHRCDGGDDGDGDRGDYGDGD